MVESNSSCPITLRSKVRLRKKHTNKRLCLTQHLLAQTHVFFLHGLAVSYWQYRMCHISHILLEHNGIGRLGVNLFFI